MFVCSFVRSFVHSSIYLFVHFVRSFVRSFIRSFTVVQISVMQRELRDLQPKLQQTSLETEELIGVIECDTVEVEAVKHVVQADEAVANAAATEAKAIKVHTHSSVRNTHYPDARE